MNVSKAARQYGASRKPNYSICRPCNNERVKALIRRRKLEALADEVKRWPKPKIKSEIAWLQAKLRVLKSL